MGGLCLIQCALALCYCNKLSNSLIKSIFNVEFLDKLDAELQNCYSKVCFFLNSLIEAVKNKEISRKNIRKESEVL